MSRDDGIIGVSDHGGWAVLVERVRVSAERHAKLALDAVAMTVLRRILGVALRQCPELPPTIAERIKDYRAQNVADWVMYRKALAAAAETHGWAVHWYDAKKVFRAASEALRIEDLDAHFLQLRRSIGPPWGKDHKLAMAAAIVAARAALEVAAGSTGKPAINASWQGSCPISREGAG